MTNLKFALFMIFSLTACGASVDMSSLVARLDRSEARASAIEARNTELERDNADLMAGRPARSIPTPPPARPTPQVTSPRPAPYVARQAPSNGMLQMCDGVDGNGMLRSGMLNSTMAFTPGSQPWNPGNLEGMVYTIINTSVFDVAIAIDGRIVHTFSGGTPLMVSDTSGMCAMPAIPRRMNGTSYTSVRVPLVDHTEQNEHEITFFCYRSAGGRIATSPAYRGNFTFSMEGSMERQISNALCGQPGTP